MRKDPRLLYGKPIRERILSKVRDDLAVLAKRRPIGRLVSIAIGNTDAVDIYIRNQARLAKSLDIPFQEIYWDHASTQEECKAKITALNDDPDVVGVILQRPVPDHINVRSLQSTIHPLKDVEGMSPASIGNIVFDDIALAPCTAAASVELIKATGMALSGLEVVVVGHSAIVGKPAAFLLMAQGATVTVCHHMTRSVAAHTRRADVVLVGVGKPKLIGAEMIKPGAAVIDIGINEVTDASGKKIVVGDVDTDAVKEVASWVTPAPGGVGPVTVSILMQNTVAAFRKQLNLNGSA